MREIHIFLGIFTVAINVFVGVWGLLRSRKKNEITREKPKRDRSDMWFAHFLAVAQYSVIAVGLMGLALWADKQGHPDRLHIRVYGPFMLIAIVAAYGFKTADIRANTRVFAIVCLVVAALGVRALQTG